MTEQPRSEDMGDEEQESDTQLYEKYIEDPPDDLVIGGTESRGEIGIGDYVDIERRPGEVDESLEEPDDPDARELHVIEGNAEGPPRDW